MSSFNPQVINEKVLALMRQHGTNWKKPWVEKTNGLIPKNAVSGRHYHGINVFILLSTNYESRHWATYKQWRSLGAQVRGGEKGTQVILFRFVEVKQEDSLGSTSIPLLRTFTVFNSEQVDGWTPSVAQEPTLYDTQGSRIVINIVSRCNISVRYGGNRAYYSQAGDYIGMPEATQFRDSLAFDGTLLHEIGHWTGHESRLNRLTNTGFGSVEYAKEELVAELFSLYMGLFIGLEIDMRPDHAQYLNGWIQAITEDKWAFYRAAKRAEKAMRWIAEKAGLESELDETEEEQEAAGPRTADRQTGKVAYAELGSLPGSAVEQP